MTTTRRHLLWFGASLFAACGFPIELMAQDTKPISIVTPYVRATPPAARVGGGYMIIRNNSSAPDRLLSVTSPAAKSVEIHNSVIEGGIAKMRHLGDGLAVPAKADTVLGPGALHLMFMEPTAPFVVGRLIPVVLVFERVGAIETVFEVRAMGR